MVYTMFLYIWLTGKALTEFSSNRVTDAHAICDLAMYNYVEMRSSVCILTISSSTLRSRLSQVDIICSKVTEVMTALR